MEDAERMKLEALIKELESYRGRHTELITVYVSAGANLNLTAKQLENEKSTAVNIKSKNTRKNVLDALERITRNLKLYKGNPPHGLAIFCGNISKVEGQPQIELWTIEPPLDLRVKLYRCDQEFVLTPLQDMIKAKDVFGLIVIDRNEATIGMLEGKNIRVLRRQTSGIPGKFKAGGQCLSSDTLIMKDNGEIIEIKDSHNPLLILSENFNKEIIEETPLIAKWENNKELFKITTRYPKFEIKASQDHTFFVRTENGIEEKPLSEIKEGDYLIMPEKIDVNLKDQEIRFNPITKRKNDIKIINIPEKINPKFSKILGYYLGDGNYEIDRLTFFEQRKEVADYYKQLIEKVFGIEVKYKFRVSKNYHQLRVYSRIISQLFRLFFNEKNKTFEGKIPSLVLASSNESLAAFISGFFDAEGYVSENKVGAGVNNRLLIKQLQFVLLRFGIISSVHEYDNQGNPYSDKIRYSLEIDDIESLKKFQDIIGFSSQEKRKKLENLIESRSNRNKVRQIVVNGKEVARIMRNAGLATTQFRCSDFFVNKKQLSKEMFKKNILDKLKDLDLRKRLELFYLSNLIAVKISKIEFIGREKTIDIETKNHNFIANGLIVHNSAQRFERGIEGMAKAFYRRVAEAAKDAFFDNPKLKGILIGGPVPTKEKFVDEGELPTALKEKIIGLRDMGDATESGLHDLVELSKDVLEEQAITQEKEILKKFFTMLAKNPEKISYGFDETRHAIEIGAADEVILSSELEKDKTKEIEDLAKTTSAIIKYVSVETEEGIQFKNIGGIGAILRFQIE